MKETRTYHTDGGIYAMWLVVFGLPLIPCALLLLKSGWAQFVTKGFLAPTLSILALELATTAWLSRYRLVFSSEGFSYRSWRRSWSVSYADIAKISPSCVTPIAKQPVGAYVYFKDGRRELVYTKAFSMAAIKQLFSVAGSANKSSKRTR